MRSLKHLRHHGNNVASDENHERKWVSTSKYCEEEGVQMVRTYPKVTEGQMDVSTQTEPVVVLSLAQAAVLGLISQNEIFGATIAPNGFYKGESKEGPPPPAEAMEYEYTDQLIGANGDYLPEPAGEPEPHGERRRGRTKRPRSDVEIVAYPPKAPEVKGELTEADACVHLNNKCSPAEQEDSIATRQGSLKEEQLCRNCPSCVRGAQGEGEEEHSVRNRKEEPEEEALNLKTSGETAEPPENKYYEPNEAAYEPADMTLPREFEENGQAMLWSDPEGLARRMQIDRLDINVQIDESYCVDVGEGLKRWKCRMCEKSYTSKYNLVTHILGHNGIKPHECIHCGKLFKQPSHLQTHLLTHQGTRPHKCTVCEKAFTQTSHLKRHMLQHTDVKPYSCRFCGRGFAYPSELRTHESKHENGQCHVCTQCGMEFPTYAHLKRHLSSHQGPTTYQCTECHKSFSYRSQLQNHLMKHQNLRPYVCPECGMEFVQIHHLRQHALTHKGMKEFKCDVCAREFTLSANLKRHMLIHASVRPFQCHVCFKTFVQKQTLKTHMIVHLPVKPFKCKVCGKSFNRMYNLLGHMHLHAGSKPFKCPYCSSKFNLKGNLSRHMKVKHGVTDATTEAHEPPQDAESQENYEEESFEFSQRENRAINNNNTNTTGVAKVSPMEYYSTYGKGTARCSTA
ncbi:zinc finger protein 710a isoform X1 [Nerophis ophidion]|uniref:zinc finger protein 710a isoform X1 n=1 Tax=Nerophis ophidion TaxID=159077 RepID=UPI002ADFF7AE|nr:zinc finger protein 710a isoform X1 [Nerophis ophidion]